ncbi:hypothetical protein WKW79_26310 [Variovorax robiniae]|uniref:Uncharacterized protein n=1 Tax=Variovorax robiniae TaxID=1836199 RepID=A0ABU8XE36_9BURK
MEMLLIEMTTGDLCRCRAESSMLCDLTSAGCELVSREVERLSAMFVGKHPVTRTSALLSGEFRNRVLTGAAGALGHGARWITRGQGCGSAADRLSSKCYLM